MKKFFINTWKDPVWSKIIATAIIGLVVFLSTKIFSTNSKPALQLPVNHPSIVFRLDDATIYNSLSLDYSKFSILFDIETSNGTYKLIDSIRIDEFKVLQEKYFYNFNYSNPTVTLESITLDKLLLDGHHPETTGIMRFKTDFVLDGNELGLLYSTGKEEKIAEVTISFPYEFEATHYKERARFNIFVKG